MPRRKIESDPKVVFRVAQLFFEGVSVREIAKIVNEEFRLARPLNRERVYPLLADAREMNLVRLVAPLEKSLADAVAQKFGCSAQQITVVPTQGKHLNVNVANKAADITLELIRAVGEATGKPVGLGLGPGRATLDFSRHLGELLEAEIKVPKIKLFAISAGARRGSPSTLRSASSTSFLRTA